MASKKYVQSQTLYLAGSGVLIGATTITLTSLTDIYGNAITSIAAFGDKGYITLEPDTSNEEGATFTSITVNANTTVTLGGASTILAQFPYTETSGLIRAHSGGTKVVITDNVAFWNGFTNRNNDEALIGRWTTPVVPSAANDLTNKAYVDGVAVAGAPNASATVKGIVQEATQAQVLAKTAAGSTGAELYVNPSTLPDTLLSDYKADTGAANAYAIAPAPAITAYTVGQIFSFKAVNANTTASTLNVNGLGTKTIKKAAGADLSANDIIAGQIVVVEYDGTNFQIISPLGNLAALQKFGGTGTDGALAIASGTTNIDCANAAVVVKNYTSISITGTGALTFTNPHANGTIIILKSQGNVTLTSSATPMIDASNLGAAGGATVTSTSNNGVNLAGNPGNSANAALVSPSGGLGATSAAAGLAASTAAFTATISQFLLRYPWVVPGTGGGSGSAVWTTGQTSGTSGIGGRGGGALIIECAGNWNFTTASGISLAAQNGGNGAQVGAGCGGGGGGGGAGGTFLALYNFLTANSGTVTLTAGIGGNSNSGLSGDAVRGGAGGNSAKASGNAGTSSGVDSTKTGGDGAVGNSLIAVNTEYP